MVEPEHIGGYCPDCGTHHRVVESIPARPLRMSEVDSLKESDDIVFCMQLMWMSGDMAGMDTDEDVTEDIVLTNETVTRLLSLYKGHGWVVEVEEEHGEDEAAEDVATDVYVEATNMVSGAMKEAFGGR